MLKQSCSRTLANVRRRRPGRRLAAGQMEDERDLQNEEYVSGFTVVLAELTGELDPLLTC